MYRPLNAGMGKFMSKFLLSTLLIASSVVSLNANAEWFTKAEDDIFSGGKQAMLLGSISEMSGIAFDCTKDSLELSYIEKGSFKADGPVPVTIIVKIDSNEPVKFQGDFSRRNDEFIQASTTQDGIKEVLSQLKLAKSKMLIGLSFDAVNKKMSFSADVAGSTKAVNDFTSACELKI